MGMNDLNEQIRGCNRCRLAKTRTHAVSGEGTLDARLMLIAQAPGKNEDREGVMFIGPSGEILDDLLEKAEVARKDVYMTNLVKCKLPNNRKPKRDEIQACSRYLDREIRLIDPQTLVPLGYFATRYILKQYGISMPQSSSDTFARLFLAEGKKIYPLQHPSSLLYRRSNESYREKLITNYKKLKVLSEDCKWFPVCPIKRFYEEGELERMWIEKYCKGDWEACARYQMEENGEPHPDWLLPDGDKDEELQELCQQEC